MVTAVAPGDRLRAAFRDDVDAVLSAALPWERLSGQRVAVSGATGFLGGALVRCLLGLHPRGRVAEPLTVVALVRDAAAARVRLADVAGDPHLECLEWDLNTIGVPSIGACDRVFHAASNASPRFYATDPVGTALPNVVGTAGLLEALRRGGRDGSFLFVSSSEVYGDVASRQRLGENDYGVVDPAALRSCYAESKRAGETLCVAWQHQHRVPTFIVRPFHTYGAGLQADDGRVFADFAFDIVARRDIVMKSDGAAVRAFCHVSDAVAGFFHVLLKGEPGVPYNVANGRATLSVLELAELLVGLFPERGLRLERMAAARSADYVPSPFQRLVPDTARLEALGWSPRTAPAQGFRQMIEAYE